MNVALLEFLHHLLFRLFSFPHRPRIQKNMSRIGGINATLNTKSIFYILRSSLFFLLECTVYATPYVDRWTSRIRGNKTESYWLNLLIIPFRVQMLKRLISAEWINHTSFVKAKGPCNKRVLVRPNVTIEKEC